MPCRRYCLTLSPVRPLKWCRPRQLHRPDLSPYETSRRASGKSRVWEVSCSWVSIAHCTTRLANSTKRLSPAEPTTRPLNWTIFERHQTRVTRDIFGQYGSFGSATQGWMAGFRLVKTEVLKASADGRQSCGNRRVGAERPPARPRPFGSRADYWSVMRGAGRGPAELPPTHASIIRHPRCFNETKN
jgi:hypothetical protein